MWPFQAYPGILGGAFSHWFVSAYQAAELASFSDLGNQIGTFSVPFIVATGGLMLVALFRSARFRSFLHPICLLSMLIASTLTWHQLLFPKDLIRTLSIQLVLAAAVIAGVTASPEPTRPSRRKAFLGGPGRTRSRSA
jgi:hypothetical protein